MTCAGSPQGFSVTSAFINYAPCIVANLAAGVNVAPAGVNIQPNGAHTPWLPSVCDCMRQHAGMYPSPAWYINGAPCMVLEGGCRSLACAWPFSAVAPCMHMRYLVCKPHPSHQSSRQQICEHSRVSQADGMRNALRPRHGCLLAFQNRSAEQQIWCKGPKGLTLMGCCAGVYINPEGVNIQPQGGVRALHPCFNLMHALCGPCVV